MREAATNLEFEEAARLRDEIKRLKSVELAVMDDPLARTLPFERNEGQGDGRIKPATAAWPNTKPRRPGSKSGKPGTRAFKKKGR